MGESRLPVGSDRGPWVIDQPIRIGSHTLRNRLFVAAHQTGLAENGLPGSRYIEYHRLRAAAGASMQITGATPVSPSPLWAESGLALVNVDDSIVPGYQRLAGAIHAEGGKMLAQLAHAGPTELGAGDVLGPSPIFSELSQQVVREASLGELEDVVAHYVAAAERCRQGGLDGIEISIAHGLLLASFLSPLTNHRQDRYGGALEHRVAFPLAVLRAVRAVTRDDMILGIRLAADDLAPGGFGIDDAIEAAVILGSEVDYINAIAGNNNFLEARVQHWPPAPTRHGVFTGLAGAIRAKVTVPVAVAGRIVTPAEANDVVGRGDADLVGTVRANIADPEFIAKALSGRDADVRPCVGCNFCITEDLADRPVRCSVNPHIDRVPAPRVIGSARLGSALVVGGGPAGLEAARVLAESGVAVRLVEQSDAVGGQIAAWALAPSRAEFAEFIDWELRRLRELGVTVSTGERASVDLVGESDVDAVIIATGALPAAVALRTDHSVEVLDPLAALTSPPGGRVLVSDTVGALDAALIAERIATSAAAPTSVSLITSRLYAGEGDGITAVFPMLRRLAEIGVTVVDRAVISQISGGVVELDGVFGEARGAQRTDVVVAWRGGASCHGLADELRAAGAHPIVIGDALRPRRVVDAVAEGARTAESIIESRLGRVAEPARGVRHG